MFPSWDAVAGELFSARERRCRAHAEVHSHSRLAIADANPTLVIFVIFAFYSPAVKTGDRKSTRLNSSHGYISYAVFCLKKKKKKSHISNYSYNNVTGTNMTVCIRVCCP